LSKLTNLRKLFLSKNKIGLKGAEHLSKLINMEELDLSADNRISTSNYTGCPFRDYYIDDLLFYNDIGDDGVKHLSKLANLKKLFLYDKNIGPDSSEYLSKLTSLGVMIEWGKRMR
jgi:hypothetical protein